MWLEDLRALARSTAAMGLGATLGRGARATLLCVVGTCFTAVACGRSKARLEGAAGNETTSGGEGGDLDGAGAEGGAVGGTGAGGSGAGGSGASGSGGTLASGGAEASGGSSGASNAAAGGSGGGAGVNPSECYAVPSQRRGCEGGCSLDEAFALRCPSPITSVQMAGSNLLIEHANGASLYGQSENAGVVERREWVDPSVKRELTANGDDPVVVQVLAEGMISVDPGPFPEGGREVPFSALLDASYDEKLRLLGFGSEGLTLWSLDSDETSSALVAADATGGILLGGPEPWVMFERPSGALWTFDGEDVRDAPVSSQEGAFATGVRIDERQVVARRLWTQRGSSSYDSGVVLVNDAGAEWRFGRERSIECPANYVAEYPDICEYERVEPVTVAEVILLSKLIVHAGQPWLVSIVADVTDRCDTFTGRCFESLPCDCQYARRGSAANARLRLDNVDDLRTLSVELGEFPYEALQLDASSSERGAIFVTIAESQFTLGGGSAGAVIDYLRITPEP